MQTRPHTLTNNASDAYDLLNNLTVSKLKCVCRKYGLMVGGRKKDIVARVTTFMESLATFNIAYGNDFSNEMGTRSRFCTISMF